MLGATGQVAAEIPRRNHAAAPASGGRHNAVDLRAPQRPDEIKRQVRLVVADLQHVGGHFLARKDCPPRLAATVQHTRGAADGGGISRREAG